MVLRFSINYFIFFAAMATVVPYLQQILNMKGFRAYEIGLLLGIFEITGIVGPLVIGWFADKIGKYRIILIILAVGSGLAFLLLILDIEFPAASLVLIIFGIMYRPISSLTDALASRTLIDAVKQYGHARIWGSIGYVAISFIYQGWGFLDNSSPDRIIFVFMILMGALFFSDLSLPVIPSSSCDTKNKGKIINTSPGGGHLIKNIKSMPRAFWVGICAIFFVKAGMSGYYSFFTIYLKEVYGMEGVSGIWGLGALAEIPVILWGSRFVVRYGVAKMLILAALGTVLRLLIYASSPSVSLIVVSQLLHALSFGLLHITAIVLINNQIVDKSRALAMAIFGGLSYGLAGFIGSSLSGFILDSFGFSNMYYFCAVVSLMAVFLIIPFRKVFH